MKIIITADVHLGRQGRLRDCLWSVRVIREYALEYGIGVVVVAGDWFHDRINVDIGVGNAAIDFLEETKEEYGQDWVMFPGNHDMFLKNSWEANSLKFIDDRYVTMTDGISIIEIYGSRFWVLPFIHYEHVYMKALRAIEEQYQEGDVLLTHIGTHDATINMCFLCKHWSVVSFANSKFDRVFSGHFHCYQQVGDNLWYPGSPIPFNFDEGLVEHGFLVYDLETREVEFVNIKDAGTFLDESPAMDFITITDEDLDSEIPENSKVRIHLSKNQTDDEYDKIKERLISNGAISVTQMKLQEDEISIDGQVVNSLNINDSFSLLSTYYDHDGPAGISKPVLKELNKVVVMKSQAILDDCETTHI